MIGGMLGRTHDGRMLSLDLWNRSRDWLKVYSMCKSNGKVGIALINI